MSSIRHHSRKHTSRKHQSRKSGRWIKGAIKHPGALHRDLGVPHGQKIPDSLLQKAIRGDYGPSTQKRAVLARTLKSFHS